MKFGSFLLQFSVLMLFLMPFALADLTINSSNSFSASHNSVLQIPIAVNSTTVNETKAFEAPSSLGIDASGGTNRSNTFVLKNNGNVNLTNITVTQLSKLEDNDGDEIKLNITSNKSLASLKPGESVAINVTASVPSAQDLGTYTASLRMNSTENAVFDLSLSVNMAQNFCDDGVIGAF